MGRRAVAIYPLVSMASESDSVGLGRTEVWSGGISSTYR
jgi:hypothetical protein